MPNRQGRAVPVEHVTPRALVEVNPFALSHVPRDEGAGLTQIAGATGRLADTLGRYADEAAALEGKRAGEVAGTDPSYRPTGETTVRGRAFESAAVETYVNKLDAQTRADAQAVFDANRSDPQKLGAAFDTMQSHYTDQHVFPEIQGRFDASFQKLRTTYLNQARTNQESNQKDSDKAGLIESLNTVDTTAKQAIASLDPNTPGVEDIVRGGIAKKEELYRQAAKSEAISEATAAAAIAKSRREDLGALIYARAQKLTEPDAVKQFSDNLAKDFHDGKIKGLDGDGYDALQSSLETLQRKRLTEGRALSSALGAKLDDYVARVSSGQTPPAGEWQTLLTTAKASPDGDARVALAQGQIALATKLRGLSADDGDAVMRSLRQKWREEGGVDQQRGKLLDFGDGFVTDYRKALNTDQLGAAQSRGIIATVTPIDFGAIGTNPDAATIEALGGQVTARVAQAKALGGTLARTPQFVRPEERQRLREVVDKGGAPAMAVAAAIVKGAGADAPAVFHEIGGEAPLLAQAGVILANGGSLGAARDAFNFQALKATSAKDIPSINPADQVATDKSTLGQAFLLAPGDGIRVKQTGEAIARFRVNREGLDPKADAARVKEIYDRALREAAGANFIGDTQYGGVADYKPGAWWFGNAQTIVPPGVRADRFKDVIGAITEADLAAMPNPPMNGAKPYSAADLRALIPIATRSGYAFAAKSYASGGTMSYVTDAKGEPWVMDWSRVEPALRQRVPGAFMGGAP
jgi:hypothetical protein